MPTHFDLIITADAPNRTAEFRLLDAHGSQLAYRYTDFENISDSHQQGLFNLRDYLRIYAGEGKEPAVVAEIGVCIAEDVLGQDIFEKLWESESQRTLCIQLPGASEQENRLVAELACVPWEIARPKVDANTLGERNLLVRVVHDMQVPTSTPLELAPDEPLRVLFVFAQARGSRPLGARKERRELLRLFTKEIYPQRRVVAHFITHGVTRERLIDQIQQHNGYHIVHWSGHGHLNLLELAKPGGTKDHLSGGELLDLFTKAGGFLPRLVFLSACHSGDILRVKDWADFLAVAQGKEPGAKEADIKDLDLKDLPGFTGTAHALLHGGVPSVVAMRYTVGDDYARELAVEFYRALLAHSQPKNATAALNEARQALLNRNKHDLARFAVCDHATPVLYGAEQPGLTLLQGRSPELNPRNPRLHRIAELTTASHEHFVGRTWELAGLGAYFIGSSAGAEVKPVAVIIGLGGMGKTALVAEALALWERRFEWVLLYQAKPNPLGFDREFLWDAHIRLTDKSDPYRARIAANSRDAIWLPAESDFTGQRRFDVMMENLIAVFRTHSILLVLDNFESNLKPQAEPAHIAGQPVWACQDPAWDRCLTALASALVGTRSRVLITSRKSLAVLADGARSYPVLLGPLPPAEAALYLRAHLALSRMVFGSDKEERKLAERLLNASRFHPLLMDRLARLAADAKLRPQLLQALATLEETKDFAQLPALFATTPGDAKELDYLNDALTVSLDQLIRDASPDARRLLWMIAVANEPVTLGLLNSVWNGASPPHPEILSLLRYLVSVGLVTEEREEPEDANPNLTCHELVRERIHARMEQHPHDRGEWTENAIRLAYADRLAGAFFALQHQNMTAALQAGSRALVYCVQAEAWDRLGGFASGVVTSSSDPHLLAGLIPHLQTAAESAPEGTPRWSSLCNLADALGRGGRHEVSQPFYEQAATLARAAAEAGGENSQPAWAGLAAITGNWAGALLLSGNLDAARQRRIETAEAQRKAGCPQADVIASELESLRIDIRQGRVETALPEIEARLAQVAAWWQRHRSGQPVPEAPNAEVIARAYISALDIGREADSARQDWESALRRLDTVLEVERALERPAEDIAATRINRAIVLVELPGRFGEARVELEACLPPFENNPIASAMVIGSLAELFNKQGDVVQAITQQRRVLALIDQLPDPGDRAISHNNMSNYLYRHDTPDALAEAPHHQLAALIYRLVAGLGQDLRDSQRNYAIDFRRAHAAGIELVVPRVAELLADSAFHPLDQWLRQRQVDVAELQAEVDQLLEQVRRAVLEQK